MTRAACCPTCGQRRDPSPEDALTADVLARAIHDASSTGTGRGGEPSAVTRLLAERVRVGLGERLGWTG